MVQQVFKLKSKWHLMMSDNLSACSCSSVGTVLVIAEVRLIIGLLNNRACVCVYMCATAG